MFGKPADLCWSDLVRVGSFRVDLLLGPQVPEAYLQQVSHRCSGWCEVQAKQGLTNSTMLRSYFAAGAVQRLF